MRAASETSSTWLTFWRNNPCLNPPYYAATNDTPASSKRQRGVSPRWRLGLVTYFVTTAILGLFSSVGGRNLGTVPGIFTRCHKSAFDFGAFPLTGSDSIEPHSSRRQGRREPLGRDRRQRAHGPIVAARNGRHVGTLRGHIVRATTVAGVDARRWRHSGRRWRRISIARDRRD